MFRASALEIKMFAPSNLTTTNQTKQKASSRDGYLEIETADAYGDLTSTWDVVMAWMTLGAVWQKLFPDWPVALIGLRTVFNMKLFAHCGKEDKKVMIEYSNKFLKANALRAANREAPMDFERSMNLARNVCHEKGFDREPPATKPFNNIGNNSQTMSHNLHNNAGSFRGGASGGSSGYNRGMRHSRGAATAGRQPSLATVSTVTLPSGQRVCHYWQTGVCKEQHLQACARNNTKYLHVCSYVKHGGQVCAKSDHKKPEHDVNKH